LGAEARGLYNRTPEDIGEWLDGRVEEICGAFSKGETPPQTAPEPPPCPGCGETRLVERIGAAWACAVCARSWPALTRADVAFLKRAKIDPEIDLSR
jgi:hypothetical protein